MARAVLGPSLGTAMSDLKAARSSEAAKPKSLAPSSPTWACTNSEASSPLAGSLAAVGVARESS